jgi:signal peptidase I
MKIRKRVILSAVLAIILFAIGFYFIFFVSFIKIPTGHMKNNILPGERLAVNRLFREIKRGDIVVYAHPDDLDTRFLSRVIGLPGESIQIRKNKVYINGNELSEKRVSVKSQLPNATEPMQEISSDGDGSYRVFYYERDPFFAESSDEFGMFGTKEPFQIPEGNYFVLGDNRDNSFDSRFRGPIPRQLISGKLFSTY